MMVKKLLGDLVKEERLRRNLSQNALAENVHVSLRTISDIENYNARYAACTGIKTISEATNALIVIMPKLGIQSIKI